MGRKGGLQQTPPTHTTVHCFRTVLNVWKLLQDKDHDQTTTRFTLKEASYPCVLRQFDFPLMTRRGLSSAVASRSSGLRIFLPHGPTSSSPCWAPICLLSILPPWTEPLEKKKKGKEGGKEGRNEPPESRELTWNENHSFLLLVEQGVADRAGHVPHRMVPDDHSRGDQKEPVCTHSVRLFQGGHDLTMRVPPHNLGLWVPPCRYTLQPDASILEALHFNNGFRAQAWGERPGLSDRGNEWCLSQSVLG